MNTIDTTTITSRQPENLVIDYEMMEVGFSFVSFGDDLGFYTLPIKSRQFTNEVFSSMGYEPAASVFVDEDDIKKLCLKENHSLADFEAIRLGLKSFLRGHEVYTVNGNEYRVRREDILCEIVSRVIKGERVPKADNAQESEAA